MPETPPTADAAPPRPLAELTSDPPALTDAWPWARRLPLVGWLERNGFHPLWTALGVFVLAFLLFQVVIAPIVIGVGIAVDLARSGEAAPDTAALLERLQSDGPLLMTANTIGQIGGFALLAIAVARLHTPAWAEYLRVRRADLPGLGLAALGWAVLYPAVLWTGELNGRFPLPDWLRALEETQVDLIEGLLLGDSLSTPFLFLALAITPSICEELLFRGYLQRQVERGWGTVVSIVLVGVLFGAYHLRLSQVVPLSLLGVYLGFVVWATGSLWSGVLVHLLNNGLAVLATAFAKGDPEFDAAAFEDMGVPWYFGVAGLALAVAVGRALLARRQSVVGDARDSVPADAGASAPPPPLPPPALP